MATSTTTTATASPIEPWGVRLNGDPLPWLLDGDEPAVRHRAHQELLDLPPGDPEVVEARRLAMASDPIAAILAAQAPEGWWVAPGGGYGPKYSGTVWSLMFLDQLGADGSDPRIQVACEYVLDHSQAHNGGFAWAGAAHAARPSNVAHCLNGNLLRALIGFGRLDDERVQRSLAWQAASITGEGEIAFYRSSTSGPGFQCAINEDLPCGWGAAKAVLALARVPAAARTAEVQRALDAGVEFLLSVDPASARYPMGWGNTEPSDKWFKLGFPSGYVADILQVMEGVCEAGRGGDPRLANAVEWLLAQQDREGRFPNHYRYTGKMHIDIDRGRGPSRWVTLRAARVLKMVAEAGQDERSGPTHSMHRILRLRARPPVGFSRDGS